MLGCRPMAKVTRIKIEQCRNVPDPDIDLSVPPPHDEATGPGSAARPRFRHMILTGPNGSGKTGVLEAVATGWDGVVRTNGQIPPAWLAWSPPGDARPTFETGQHVAYYRPATRRLSVNGVSGPAVLGFGPL